MSDDFTHHQRTRETPRMESYVHDLTVLPRGDGKTHGVTCSCGFAISLRDKETAVIHAMDHIKRVALWNGHELARIEFHWNTAEDIPTV